MARSSADKTNYIHEKLDNDTPTLTIFLDLGKAFDNVKHAILYQKLECYELQHKTLNLLRFIYLKEAKLQK